MPQTLTCPRCKTSLTVADAAPNSVTCPRCLTQIDRTAFLELAAHPTLAPQPVISVEREAKRSVDVGMLVIVAIVIAVLIGLFTNMVEAKNSKGGWCLFAAVAVFTPGLLGVASYLRGRSRESTSGALPPPLPGDVYAGSDILPYARPMRASTSTGTRVVASLAYFAMGFFFAIGSCVAGFFVMLGRGGPTPKEERPLILAIVAAIVVGAAMFALFADRRFRWPGFFAGTMVGLMLGCMALGPLAFCFLVMS